MFRFKIPVADSHSEIHQQFISLSIKKSFSIYSIPGAFIGPMDTEKAKIGKTHAPSE